jgi:hypothetical protein
MPVNCTIDAPARFIRYEVEGNASPAEAQEVLDKVLADSRFKNGYQFLATAATPVPVGRPAPVMSEMERPGLALYRGVVPDRQAYTERGADPRRALQLQRRVQ